MSGRRESKKEAARKAIYEAAIESFKEQGFAQSSVAAIAKKAGVAKGTFFNYFDTKEMVLAMFLSETTSAVIMKTDREAHACAREAVHVLGRRLANHMLKYRGLFLNLSTAAPTNESLVQRNKQIDDTLVTFLNGHILDDQRLGKLRSDVDTKVMADLIISMLTGIFRTWLMNGKDEDPYDFIGPQLGLIFQMAEHKE